MAEAIETLQAALDALKESVGPVSEAIKELITPLQSPEPIKKSAGSIGGMIKDIASGGLIAAAEGIGKFIEALSPFQPIIDAISTVMGIWGSVMQAGLMPAVQMLFDIMLTPEVMDTFKKLGEAFGSLMVMLMPLLGIAMQVLLPLLDLLTIALKYLTIGLGYLPALVQFLGDSLGKIIVWLIDNAIKPLINIIIFFENLLIAIWAGVLLKLVDVFKIIGDVAGFCVKFLIEGFVWAINKVIDGVKIAITFLKFLGECIIYPFELLAWGIKWIIDKIDFLNVTGVTAGPVPAMPAWPFAEGGIAMSPTLALLAEKSGSKGEAVLPLERLKEFMPDYSGVEDRLDRLIEYQEVTIREQRRNRQRSL